MNRLGLQFWMAGLLHSYSQVFFSQNRVFAWAILVVTFFLPSVGLGGLLAVALTNGLAVAAGFSREQVKEGVFGFNALLIGLAISSQFEFGFAFVLLFLIAVVMVLIVTAVMQASLGKQGLPFLSFPFLFSYWMISLASGELHALVHEEPMLYGYQGWSGVGGFPDFIIHVFDTDTFPQLLSVFFKTLASTFFIRSVTGGVLIAASLLYFSRISFLLAIAGFGAAYYSYLLFGANVDALTNNLAGSNFIFFAIAIGGFYLIPDKFSFLSVLLFIPLLVLFQIAFQRAFDVFHLKAFTLSFSLLTILFLYALHHRWVTRFLHLVTIQYYSAEKTIYKHINLVSRAGYNITKKASFPFIGEWRVSQAYDGAITHLGDWGKALDFDIVDDKNKTYREPGVFTGDFYCYNKPVVAPMDGYVHEIINHVEDNEIGSVDTLNNWGNTIILNHLDGLYSQISHLKKDSFKVQAGAWVTKGSIVATCGNSGRSPEPHIHFQFQQSPVVGSKTLEYPVSYYFLKNKSGIALRMFEVPKEGEVVLNPEVHPLLKQAFNLIPGKSLKFINPDTLEVSDTFDIRTDAWNRLYLFCHKTGSYAYFVNDGLRFYFFDFEGDRKSRLFQFYMAAYSVLLARQDGIEMTDSLPVLHFNLRGLNWIQDFIAPFHVFTKAQYKSLAIAEGNGFITDRIRLNASVTTYFGGMEFKNRQFELLIGEKGMMSFSWMEKGMKERVLCDI